MAWSSIIGQQRVKNILKRALEQRQMSHAYLFFGNKGVGKDAVAIELAKVLNCERGGIEACGECGSCLKMATLQHPNVKFVFALPVGKNERVDDPPLFKLSDEEIKLIQEQIRLKAKNPYHTITIPKANIIKINSIRDIRKSIAYKVPGNVRRVIVISNADDMNDESANALLKTLEEPSGETMLILTTSRKDNLLPTIISRCQPLRFDPLSETDIREALLTRHGVSDEQAALIARLANGSYTRAVELLETDLNQRREEMVNFLRLILSNQPLKLLIETERLASFDRTKIEQMLSIMLLWFRDVLVLREGGGTNLINIDQKNDIERFSKNFPRTDVHTAMMLIERAAERVDKNVHLHLVLLTLVSGLRGTITQ
jgi:DNA polymerase-3 subunit delta'